MSRLLAVVAVVSGLAVGAAGLPASAAAPAHHSAAATRTAAANLQPNDWWG